MALPRARQLAFPDWKRKPASAVPRSACRSDEARTCWQCFSFNLSINTPARITSNGSQLEDGEAEGAGLPGGGGAPEMPLLGSAVPVKLARLTAPPVLRESRTGRSGRGSLRHLTDGARTPQRRHSLAATLALRAMVAFALSRASQAVTATPPSTCAGCDQLPDPYRRTGRAWRITSDSSAACSRLSGRSGAFGDV